MFVDIAIQLFDLPGVELSDYDMTGDGIREFAANQASHLGGIADTVDKRLADGWAVRISRCNLEARHPQVTSHADAVERLPRLQIEEDGVTDIAEWNKTGERLTPP